MCPLQQLRPAEEPWRDGGAAEAAAAGSEGVVGVGQALGAREAELVGAL